MVEVSDLFKQLLSDPDSATAMDSRQWDALFTAFPAVNSLYVWQKKAKGSNGDIPDAELQRKIVYVHDRALLRDQIQAAPLPNGVAAAEAERPESDKLQARETEGISLDFSPPATELDEQAYEQAINSEISEVQFAFDVEAAQTTDEQSIGSIAKEIQDASGQAEPERPAKKEKAVSADTTEPESTAKVVDKAAATAKKKSRTSGNSRKSRPAKRKATGSGNAAKKSSSRPKSTSKTRAAGSPGKSSTASKQAKKQPDDFFSWLSNSDQLKDSKADSPAMPAVPEARLADSWEKSKAASSAKSKSKNRKNKPAKSSSIKTRSKSAGAADEQQQSESKEAPQSSDGRFEFGGGLADFLTDQIERSNERRVFNSASAEELAASSIELKDELLTENYVDLLEQQGKLEQAVAALERMRLLHPDKNDIFASRINEINEKR